MSEPEGMSPQESPSVAVPSSSHSKRDGLGVAIGLLTFFFGIFLLSVTFKAAFELFETPPATSIGISHGKTINLGLAGESIASTIFKILFLVVMAFVGSIIANRGIGLYCGARHPHPPHH